MFQSPIIPGLLAPIAFILIGAMCKKLVRSSPFKKEDFFMGIELTLATMSAQLIFLIETFQKTLNTLKAPITNVLPSGTTTTVLPSVPADSLLMTVSLLALTLLLLITLLAVHQSNKSSSTTVQHLTLTGFSNLVGIGLMFTFVYMVKG
jgi:hypothetical protein